MKRSIFFIAASVVIFCGGYALHYSLLWKNHSPQAQQQWIVALFEKKGFHVKWEHNNTISPSVFSLKLNEKDTSETYERNFVALRTSTIIQFYERSDGTVFFVFGERIYSITQNSNTGTESTLTLSVPNTNEVWFTLRGGGEFSLQDTAEIIRLFPYPEVRSLETRPNTILLVSSIMSLVLIVYPPARHLWHVLQSRAREKKSPALYHTPPPNKPPKLTRHALLNPNTLTVPDSQKHPNHEQEKSNLLAELQAHIREANDPEIKERLEALYERLTTEKRLSIVRHALDTTVPAILAPEDTEPVRHENSRNVEDALTARALSSPQYDPIESALKHIENLVSADTKNAARLILQVLINPGGAPYFGEHKMLRARLLRRVTGAFPLLTPNEFWQTYGFLKTTEVIMESVKHGAGRSCSLNPHVSDIHNEVGKEIISILVRLRQEMTRSRSYQAPKENI